MRRALAFGIFLVACGARPPTPVVRPPAGPATTRVGDVRVVATHRSTGGQAALGLFVRTRDGSAALRATAALVIEARGAGAWRVRATPDGLAIRSSTEVSALDDALRSLAAALRVRDATAEEVGTALAHARLRRAARGASDDALAARLALEALAGTPLDPFLGDESAVTSGAVSAWLAAALGVERALVGVVGDVDQSALEASIASAFASAPHVVPEPDEAPPWRTGPARVASGAHPVAAAATWVSSLDEAARVADWVERLAPHARASSFPLLGRAIVSATQPGDEGALRALASALEHARMLDDERAAPSARDADGELLAIGDAWLARVAPAGAEGPIALALVRVSEGDADDTTDPTLDALARPTPVTPSRLDADRGEATLQNGLSIRVARSAGDAVAVALAFRAGAALDPPREHGRAALLAAVLARSCEPDADGYWVDDATFGVVVRGARDAIERTTLRVIDCARRATTEVEHAESARAGAIADLDLGQRVLGWASSVLAPSAPGLLAPQGSPAGIAAATELEDAMRDALDPRGATLVVVGDEAPERMLAVAHALGSVLRAGSGALPEARAVAEGPAEAFATEIDLEVPIGIVALRTDSGASEVGARFVARALAEQLAARELPVRAFSGRAAATGSSFVIVAVTGTDERLDHLGELARSALGELVPAGLPEDDARAERDRALALAAPEALARSLVAEASTAAADGVARALLSAPVHLILVRPTAGPFRRTR